MKNGRRGKESGGKECQDLSLGGGTDPHSRRLFVAGQTHAIPMSDLWIQSESWGSSSRFSTRLTCTVRENFSHHTGFRKDWREE